eukprot:PhF_6_TR29342/c1_g1_i8/m.43083
MLIKEDLIYYWGVRTRFISQHYRNGTSSNATDSFTRCGYFGVDASIPVDYEKYVLTGDVENYDKSFQNRMYFRKRRNSGLPPYLYELMMNVSFFVKTNESQCRDVVGFNVSWSLEYFYSLFLFSQGYYVQGTDENITYAQYLSLATGKPKLYAYPTSFHSQEVFMDVFGEMNYLQLDGIYPSGWVCGRGLGNGTWIWECGPDEGKPLTFTKWAPGEPTLLDGCLYVNSTSDI